MGNHGWELLGVCHYIETFCDHRHCDNDKMFLSCHVTSRDLTFKELLSVNLWVESPNVK